ncbi:MAG: hypothetical protein P4M11_09555 [Candidatus Pacebacteria bacterium]|nr:hypothetical protein [Candidatus Paceibacterota bacterium]
MLIEDEHEPLELGFIITNPDAPPDEPRKFEAINPTLQREAEKLFWELRQEGLAVGK